MENKLPVEEKAKKILGSDKAGLVKPPLKIRLARSKLAQIGVSSILIFFTFATALFIAIYTENLKKLALIKDYESCAKFKDSLIQKTYPKTCITKDGRIFREKVETKNTPISTTENPEGQSCGGHKGIPCPSGYTCKLEGNYLGAKGVCIKN